MITIALTLAWVLPLVFIGGPLLMMGMFLSLPIIAFYSLAMIIILPLLGLPVGI